MALKNSLVLAVCAFLVNVPASHSDDQWLLASPRVCFGAKGNSYGLFAAPIDGNLVAIKLVYQFGYVSCAVDYENSWSFWGCGEHIREMVNTIITDSHNHTLMPPTEFEKTVAGTKYYKIPGYNSTFPEIILSRFSSTPVFAGKQLRLWYGEDLENMHEADNDGRVCCTAYAMYS
ncbi:uncharacterized protein LOC122964011 [Acropora millepora]|uniref:uncharacterized protein LOC122964011 n=1 Tax=Acropora millepora TaxID=45264 RepID=UPI001CF3A186|nr:uncharacterized protein LOC122964011 [Acropora millepora]